MTMKVNEINHELFTSLTDEEKKTFDIFLDVKITACRKKAEIQALKKHWAHEFPKMPVAQILRGENVSLTEDGKKYPKKKILRNYLESDIGKKEVDMLLSSSKVYRELCEAKEGSKISAKLWETFSQMKDMMLQDIADGKEISSLARYTRRNGVSPFEREIERQINERELKCSDRSGVYSKIIEENIGKFESDIEKTLSEQDFLLTLRYSNYYTKESGGLSKYPPHFSKKELRRKLIEADPNFYDMSLLLPISQGSYEFKLFRWIRDRLNEAIPDISKYSHKRDEFGYLIEKECKETSEKLTDQLQAMFNPDRIKTLVLKNPNYTEELEKYKADLERAQKKAQEEEERFQNIMQTIPKSYKDSFPDARNMHRKFILHIGPTNSGKTHDAVEALKAASHGVYLAPLRLLAFEQYETLSDAGVKCSMVTGEEQILTEGATVQSSTIEMLQTSDFFDIAVIDEAQMIADRSRGGAWCTALYGVMADVVHVCAAPEAEDILKRIILDCGDEFEIVKHQRLAVLSYDDHVFNFPKDVQPGDALICFSRRNVHAVAGELAAKGISASVIYGSLPYDVRHEEARRFADGETSVVVSTDAIGMGMNLPIKRVVFLEAEKFDGCNNRPLNASEVKQIAGRAGRYGIYDIGTVASCTQKIIRKGLNNPVPEIKKVVIDFPNSLVTVPGKLSNTIEAWKSIPADDGFEKADVSNLIELAKWCEKHTVKKNIIIQFIRIPFDVRNEELFALWQKLFLSYMHNEIPDISAFIAKTINTETNKMEELEFQYSYLDLLYNYCRRFLQPFCECIQGYKAEISGKIIEQLKKQGYRRRTCKYCGRPLPWNYPYAMCQKCHDELYSERYYYDYY